MIEYRNTNEAIDITFRVYQSKTWYRFIVNRAGIKKILFIDTSKGSIKSVKLKCDECKNISCFCLSKFKTFNEAHESYFFEVEQYERRKFQKKKNYHLKSVK